MKNNKVTNILVLMMVLFGCNTNNKTELEIGNGNDVIVALELTDKKDIEKIEFQANGKMELVTDKDLNHYNVIKYGFNGRGEGTYRVCVYTKNDTICRVDYVEGGYRPKLKCNAKRIEFQNNSGY
jgi:hypothetical protein